MRIVSGPVRTAFWAVLAVLVISGLVNVFTGYRGPFLFCARTGLSWAETRMVTLSIAAVLMLLFANVNLRRAFPIDLRLAPALLLVASADALKLEDANWPVWNTTIMGLAAPTAASILMGIYWRFFA